MAPVGYSRITILRLFISCFLCLRGSKFKRLCSTIAKTLTQCTRIKTPKTMKEDINRPRRLQNIVTKAVVIDTLANKATIEAPCTRNVCNGSLMFPKKSSRESRPKEALLKDAKEFINEYYMSINQFNSVQHDTRWDQIISVVKEKGTYILTQAELMYGAKLAWRNAARCIGRIQWSNLQMFDAQKVSTPAEMFETMCIHIKYATNDGNIRSAITIFPPRTDGEHDFRVWNPQLFSYAGYLQEDGSCIGDPNNCEFTEICQRLGWPGMNGQWDILPLVLSANGEDPEWFELPIDLITRVPISHPEYAWFTEMGLQWYAVPGVSNMLFDCGGLEFPACPFNGWYMSTEIAARNLCDPHRLNILEEVALKMGLDTCSNTTLWKDKALVEVNVAVLHSFQTHNVTIVDHHTASESFMKHFETEQRIRGGCPADWVWIVPPVSGSLCPVFHQEMSLFILKPSYEYQDNAWKTHTWKNLDYRTNKKNYKFKEIALAVAFESSLFQEAFSKREKITILYATETGKSQHYANKLQDIFNHMFNTQVYCMADYDLINLTHESFVLVVASTFGNGEPPENGKGFAKNLKSMKKVLNTEAKIDDVLNSKVMHRNNVGPLSHVRHAVFALGSSAYPIFCGFGKYVDNLLTELGGQSLMPLTCGDEMAGQEQSFKHWAAEIFKRGCDTYCAYDDEVMQVISQKLKDKKIKAAGSIRFKSATKSDEPAVGLSRTHGKNIRPCKVLDSIFLHSDEVGPCTQQVILSTGNLSELTYRPGDHVAILPVNQKTIVDAVLARLNNCPKPNLPVQIMVQSENTTLTGNSMPHKQLPTASIKEMLTRYLDITTPPTPTFLQLLADFAKDEKQKEYLNSLANNPQEYEEWKFWNYPDLKEVLEMFSSVQIDAYILLTNLPILQRRLYSISSSPDTHSGEIHLTVGNVEYRTQEGQGPLHKGVCTNFLKHVNIGDDIECYVRIESGFHMPADPERPIIMIGAGTGVAPFRSFWHQKHYDITKRNEASSNMTLLFGCRNKSMDIYAEEKQVMKRDGILSQTYLALSRVPTIPKTYVQDHLVNAGEKVYQQIVKEKGHIYVCGAYAMGECVLQELKSIVKEYGNLSDEEVDQFVLQMKDENRYHEDLYGSTLFMEQIRKQEHKSVSQNKQKCDIQMAVSTSNWIMDFDLEKMC